MNATIDIERVEAAFRERDYRKVCQDCGVLLEKLLQGLLGELRALDEAQSPPVPNPGKRPQVQGSETLGWLLDQFKSQKLFAALPEIPGRPSRKENARFVNWEILDVVKSARNAAVHARPEDPSHAMAAECIDATRAMYRWFSRGSSPEARGEFAGTTLVDGLGACKEPLQAAISFAARSGRVHVKVLGLTLGEAWRLWSGEILRALPPEVAGRADFALIDPGWRYTKAIDPRWEIQAKGIVRTLAIEAPQLLLRHPNLEIRVWKYRWHPSIHGAMVNNDFLAASLLAPKLAASGVGPSQARPPLEAARGRYFLLRAGAGPVSDLLHEHYQAAFALVSDGEPWRCYTAPRAADIPQG